MNNIKPYEKYKGSGIAWLGDVPVDWEVKKLKYLAECFPSNVDKHTREGEKRVRLCNYTDVYKNDLITDKMQLMMASASVEQIRRFTLLKGDVIITKDSETANDIAVPALVAEDLDNVICGYHLSVIRQKPNMIGSYLLRLFQHKKFNVQFEVCSNGVTRVGLGVYDLQNAFGICPSIPEQIAIANFLDYKTAKIDRFIKKKKQLIKLLNEQKAGIINDAVTKGLDANVKMKSSGIEWLGHIPEHWEVRKLKYVVNYFKGFAFKSVDYSKEGNPIVKASNLKQNTIKNIDSYVDFKNERSEFEGVRLKTNDVILSTVGSKPEIVNSAVGQVSFVEKDFENSYLNQNTVCLRPTNSELNPNYLKSFFLSKYFRQVLNSMSLSIANQAYLQIDSILNINIGIPSYEEQIAIFSYIETETTNINKAIATIEKEIALVQEYKTALIAEAVTGKIDVRDYEIPVIVETVNYEDIEQELSMVAEDEEGYGINEAE